MPNLSPEEIADQKVLPMSVAKLANDVDSLGVNKLDNDKIVGRLQEFANGNFNNLLANANLATRAAAAPFTTHADLLFKNTNEKTMILTANNALKLIDENFKDANGNRDAKAGMKFLQDIKDTELGKMDFNQLVQRGDAHKLIKLHHRDPQAFAAIANNHYASAQELENAINAIPLEGPDGKRAPTPASAPDSAAPVPATEKQAYGGHNPNRRSMGVELAQAAAIGVGIVEVEKIAVEAKAQTSPHTQAKNTHAHKLSSAFTV